LNENEYKSIGNVESWFFKQIEEADLVLIYNKSVKNGNIVEGYVGINTSMDIGYALGKGKEVILVYPPLDDGIKGLYSIGLVKVMKEEEIIDFLRKKIKSYSVASYQ